MIKRTPAYLLQDQSSGLPRGYMLPQLWAKYRDVPVLCVCNSCMGSWREIEQRADNTARSVRMFDYCSRCPQETTASFVG